MENKNIIYSIAKDGSAHITEIQPNDKGQIIVPEFLYKNGIQHPVCSIDLGFYNDVDVIAHELYLPQTIQDFNIVNRHLKEIHFHGDLETLSGILVDCIALEKVVIHGSLKQIGYGTFEDCFSLKEIIIEKGNSVDIGCSAFKNCSNLECISVRSKPIVLKHRPNSFCLSAFCGCFNYKHFEGDVILEDGLLLSLDKTILYTIAGRKDDDGIYKIPNTVRDMIHNMAYNKLKKIDFSGCGLTQIDDDAFNGCNSLEEVVLPCNDIEIGDRAFLNCGNLHHVGNFNRISKFGIASFSRTGIKECVLSSMVSELPKSVFIDCNSLETVIIPTSIKTITNNVFEGCANIKFVKISEGYKNSLDVLFKDARNVEYSFFYQPQRNYHRPSGAYTHGNLNCPYCGSSNRTTYADGTAECNNCGGEYRYW